MSERLDISKFTFREFEPSDLPDLLALNRQIIADSIHLDYPDPDSMITDYLGEELGRIFVVRDTSGNLVGMNGFKPSEVEVFGEDRADKKKIAKLNLLRVDPSYSGHGIASRLIKQTEKIAAASSYDELHLSVEESGPVGLYEKLGYKKYKRVGGKGDWDEERQARVLLSENGNPQVVFDLRKALTTQ
jgi:ribosomal protein S18 acetylase RimI-like enzyme